MNQRNIEVSASQEPMKMLGVTYETVVRISKNPKLLLLFVRNRAICKPETAMSRPDPEKGPKE